MPANSKIIRAARNRRYYEAHGKSLRAANLAPFIGVDGEGGGCDEIGRQHFLLLRAGRMELFKGNTPLSTRDCLDFILSTPRNAILVGYYFTYDATQILRDLPIERLKRLFEEKEHGEGFSPYTFWGDYAIDFRPKQYFRVARLNRETLKVFPGSSRTINEVGGFFQKSFVEAIKDWQVGDPTVVDMIANQKDNRENFTVMSETERRYCAAECNLLAEMMEKFRHVCIEAKIEPRAWRGAGWLSARLHELHNTPKRRFLQRSASLETAAIRAYYGGRFEVTTIGQIGGPVYEYDINSAYPAAMLELPCPIHTRWRPLHRNKEPERTLDYVARVTFVHNQRNLCHLPMRRKGRLFWPVEGEGIYWGVELNAAINAGTIVKEWKGGYYAERRCDCPSNDWIAELYAYRKSLGKSTIGYPIKLGLNGLYGKYAQRQGAAPWRDYIAAGMITAITRAKLIEAYRSDPGAIVYLATDALFSRRQLTIDIGDALGQCEEKIRPDGIFIVQPGIYWSGDAIPKTRGIPRSKVIEARANFEAVWKDWVSGDMIANVPYVSVAMKTFIGHRQALAWGKPEVAGSWIALGNGGREISFDWSAKRDAIGIRQKGAIITTPRMGGIDMISEPYDPRALTEFASQLMLDEAADDFIHWGNSGE